MRFHTFGQLATLGLLLVVVGLALMLLTAYGAAGVFLLIVGIIFLVVGH